MISVMLHVTNAECHHAVCHQCGVSLFCVLEVLSVIMLCATNAECHYVVHYVSPIVSVIMLSHQC